MKNQTLTLMIMAAGIGSRYGGLKQMERFGPEGETLIDYSLYDAHKVGFHEVIFIIRKDIESEFQQQIVRPWEKYFKITLAYQELASIPQNFSVPLTRKKPWGTSHAVLCTRDLVRNPFAVINADDYYGRSAFELLIEFLRQIKLFSLTLRRSIRLPDLRYNLASTAPKTHFK